MRRRPAWSRHLSEICNITLLAIAMMMFSDATGALASSGHHHHRVHSGSNHRNGHGHHHHGGGDGNHRGRHHHDGGDRHGKHGRPGHGKPMLPQMRVPRLPAVTASRYMTHANGHRSYALGCGLGTRTRHAKHDLDTLVILDYGMPMHYRRRFGASVFGSFRSTKQIAYSVRQYVRGYALCSEHERGSRLSVGVGTSNYGGDVTYRHGQQWGAMVAGLGRWLRSKGLEGLVDVSGANDIEPGWRGPDVTKRWIRGYASRTDTPYFFYGGAAGCPPYEACLGSWTMEDLWYAAWGSRHALPVPEVYAGSGVNALQWYRLSLYGYRHHGKPMRIAGVMSQAGSCTRHRDCTGMANQPKQAFSQLYRALNGDPRTAQSIRWVTDITWRS
jgi:hypothetical protein